MVTGTVCTACRYAPSYRVSRSDVHAGFTSRVNRDVYTNYVLLKGLAELKTLIFLYVRLVVEKSKSFLSTDNNHTAKRIVAAGLNYFVFQNER